MKPDIHHAAMVMAAARANKLPPRQRDILNRIGHCESSKMIADNLGLSINTVENTRHIIYMKLRLTGLCEAVRLVGFLEWE